MKGLILKDLMCLRKQRIIFSYLVVATLVLSVMFVLSAKFGNIYQASQEMITMDQIGGIAVDMIATEAILFFMLCPLAMAGEVTTVFVYDGRAEFGKVASSFPLTISKRVLAKFIAAFSMLFVGVVIDLLIAFVLSLMTDIVTFSEFFGIIISATSILLIYGGLAIFFCFCFGFGKESYAQGLAVILMVVTFALANFSKIKQFFIAEDGSDVDIVKNAMDALKYQYYIPLFIACLVMLLSYCCSVFVANRKRGMI